MVKLGTGVQRKKSSIDFGGSEWLGGREEQGGSRNSSGVDWDRLSQYHQSAKVSLILLKVGVPSTAEAPHAYLGPPLVTISL